MLKTNIVKVEVGFWSRLLKQGMDISRGGFKTRSHVFLRFTDADGVRGYGEGVGDTQKNTQRWPTALIGIKSPQWLAPGME